MEKIKFAMGANVKSMEVGGLGLHGQAVEVIAKCQETECVTIQHLPMEDQNVWAKVKKIKFALKVNAKSMEDGEAGLLGLFV